MASFVGEENILKLHRNDRHLPLCLWRAMLCQGGPSRFFLSIGFFTESIQYYFDKLYHSLAGTAVMTLCLGVYLGAYILSRKIAFVKL